MSQYDSAAIESIRSKPQEGDTPMPQATVTREDLDALILAVSHAEFAELDTAQLKTMFKQPQAGIIIDVKSFLDKNRMSRDFTYWRL